LVEHPRHGEPGALAARQDAGFLVDVVTRKEKAAKDVADCRHHGVRRTRLEYFVDRARGVEPRRFVLRKVLRDHLMAFGALARVGWLFAREHAHQRRLTSTVVTHERDAIAPFNVQVHVVQNHPATVGLRYVLELLHHAAASRRCGELKVNPLPFRRYFNALDLLEHLDSALYLRRLGGLIPKAIDEFLDAAHLFVLPSLGGAKPFEPRVALLEVFRIVAVIVGNGSQRQVGDVRDDRIEEVAIV
jgi:hypothetical protein